MLCCVVLLFVVICYVMLCCCCLCCVVLLLFMLCCVVVVVCVVLCCGDRIDAVVVPWLEQLWQSLMRLHPLPVGVSVISDLALYPSCT